MTTPELPPIPPVIADLLRDPQRREDGLKHVARWAADLCLALGSEVHTAHFVAAYLVKGLKAECQK